MWYYINTSLEEYIKFHKTNKEKSLDFVSYLYYLMDKYKFDSVALYNKANISKRLFSSVISNKSKLSINFIIKIVFTMHLNNHECKYLLKKASFTLASNSNYSLIIRYFIESNNYNLNELNETLIKYGYQDKIKY